MKNTDVRLGNGIDLMAQINLRALASETYKKNEVNEQIDLASQFTNPEGVAADAGITNPFGALKAGYVAAGKPLVELLQDALFSYQTPSFSSFTSNIPTTVECGYTTPANLTFNWGVANASNILPDTVKIRDVTGGADIATGLAVSGSPYATTRPEIVRNTIASYRFQISASQKEGADISRNLDVNWLWYWYVLTDSNDAPAPTPEQIASGSYITSAQLKAASVKVLAAPAGRAVTFPGGSRRIVIAYPSNYGDIKKIVSSNLNLDVLGSFVKGTAPGITGATDDAVTSYKVYVYQADIPTPSADTYTISF